MKSAPGLPETRSAALRSRAPDRVAAERGLPPCNVRAYTACLLLDMHARSGPSFSSLLYRYWFFGWLFRDASRGSALERDAALRHNLERARWLPTYMRRWTVLGLLMYGFGGALEWLGLHAIAPLAFVPVCVAAPVLAVATATWWLLRGPRSAYVRRPLR